MSSTGPQNMFDWAQKIFADWEYVLGARQRLSPIWDSPSVRFDKAARSIKICLALSRLQRRKLTRTVMVIRNMNTTWISCKYTIIISGLSGRESSRWYLTSEDWPLALAGWLIGSLQDRMFQECRNLDYRWLSWESLWKMLSRKRTERSQNQDVHARCGGGRRYGQGRILLKNFLTWFSSSEIRWTCLILTNPLILKQSLMQIWIMSKCDNIFISPVPRHRLPTSQ